MRSKPWSRLPPSGSEGQPSKSSQDQSDWTLAWKLNFIGFHLLKSEWEQMIIDMEWWMSRSWQLKFEIKVIISDKFSF